jgi:hypothetical protein
MNTAPRGTGFICDLLFDDMAGHFATEGYKYFLDADGCWFQISPPERFLAWWRKPINWRPSYVRLTPERRNLVKNRAT